nr:putative ribonuclease H-like domain-containing protein [Tanacetum cinerariifolium]
MDKCKIRLGYNTVPPPYTGNFMPPKPDLVYPSLDDFVDVNEYVSESVVEKPTVESIEPKTASKENRALIIENWVSKSEEEDEPKFQTVKPNLLKLSLLNLEPIGNLLRKLGKTHTEVLVLNVVQGNYVNDIKASACWVWRPKHKVLDHVSKNNSASITSKKFDYGNPRQDLKDKGVINSGCSRHMTENRSDLTDYKEIDGGFIAFGGNSKGRKITGKSKIRTGKLDFEDVYFVKELKFNLFSVLQMCDKKNSVLFTDVACVVLSPNFKLTEESHVLLKVPRKDNMYSVDLKNVVPQRGTKNLIELRVKVIRCDNRNEFKNRVMNQFCKMKGRKSALSFMRPFGCLVTILNTIDHLGSGPNWLFDINVLTKSMNYKPVVAGNQSNGSASTKACDNIGEEEKKDAKDPGNKDSEVQELIKRRMQMSTALTILILIEAIRPFLAYALFKDFVVYLMDAKSAFLYGKIEKEVYVYQPPGFKVPDFPGRIYKVEKALYGLQQASRAWYETLSTYLLDNRFQRGMIDKTLFIKRDKIDILLVQVYVNIIFGSTRKEMCTEFEKMMHKKLQMSSIGELTFFLRLQVKQKEDGIFISQDKYVNEILDKFGFFDVKTASTPMETHKNLLKDEKREDVDENLYRSTIGSLMYHTSLRPDIMVQVNFIAIQEADCGC